MQSGKASSDTTEISSVVERVIKDSRAVDTEALCIVSGEKVWSLRCDIHILDHGGNLIDASCLSAMAALMHFRRPDISVQGDKIKVSHGRLPARIGICHFPPWNNNCFGQIHTYEERAPVPLSIHHIPVCVSYGIFPIGSIQEAVSKGANPTSEDTMRTLETGEDVLVLDPTHKEEHAMEGKITFALNAHGELCGIHKLGGAALAKDVTMRAAKHASVVAANIVSTLKSTLVKADELEKERDRVRHSLAAGYRTDSNKLIPLFNEFMDLHDDEKESASKTNTTVHLDGSDFLKDSYVRLPSAEQKKKHKSFPMRGDEESQETHQETKAVSGSTNEMSKSHSDNSSQDDDMLDDEFDT